LDIIDINRDEEVPKEEREYELNGIQTRNMANKINKKK